MKKVLAGLLIGSMVFMLAACGAQKKEPEAAKPDAPKVEAADVSAPEAGTADVDAPESEAADADAPKTEDPAEEAPEEEIYVGMTDMLFPWVDSDHDGVLAATGFDLAPPEGAANVAYSYMPSTGMAQLNYVMDHARWVYRMKPANALEDISDIHCDWDYVGETKVAGMDAMEYSWASEPEGDSLDGMDCTRVINWYDAQKKVTCSLVVGGADLNGLDTAAFAEELYAPESDGIGPIDADTSAGLFETDMYQSYLGLHVNGYDGSTILVEEGGENGRLKVNVSITRLCALDDGTGIYEYDTVSFSATDPSGNRIRCCLYYNSDNSLCMKVEDSSWNLLPSGTVLDGFDD